MAEYVEIEHAKTLSGLRLVLPPGRPNPWGEALKGMCYLKQIPYTRVRKAQGHDAAFRPGPVRVVRPSLSGTTSGHAPRGLSSCTSSNDRPRASADSYKHCGPYCHVRLQQ